jgi:hypothetical protein
LRWGLVNLFVQTGWNHSPPNLSLLYSMGGQVHTTTLSYQLRWQSLELFAWASLEL